MKIVHLVGFYMPELGYQENYVAEEHSRMGHDVHVITSNLPYPFLNITKIMREAGAKNFSGKFSVGTKKINGVKIHRLKSKILYSDLILIKGLKEKLEEIKPDIVFAHESRQSPPYFAAKMKNKIGYTLVTDQHDFHHEIPGHSFLKKILRELDYFFLRNCMVKYTLKKSDAVIAVTEQTSKYLREKLGMNGKRINVVNLGVDMPSFKKSESKRNKIREKYGVERNEVLFGFAGTIVRRKGVEILLDAFSKMGKNNTENAKLMIVGNGENSYMNEIKKMAEKLCISEKVIFTGFIPKAELSDYFSAFDAGVWPGNNSVVIMEAMACELPVIMVKLQLSHLVRYGNGFSFSAGDTKNLTNAMIKLMNPLLRKKMGRNSRKAVADSYSYKKIAEQFMEIAVNARKKK